MLLPLNSTYIAIGDVHGCIDELKALLARHGFTTNSQNLLQINRENNNKSIILLGDFIDKGDEKKIAETIEFIYKNYHYLNQTSQHLYLILGNHEAMVYRYIINDPSLKITPKTIKQKEKYYNTVALLEKNSTLKSYFIELYKLSQPYFYYNYSSSFSVTFTHAPCPEKYLRKEDEYSKKQMIKCVSRSSNPLVELDELIPYTHTEARENEHYHIFGHLSQPNIRQYKNKICIDTSAIYGKELSCAIVKKNSLSFDSIPFLHKQPIGEQTESLLFDF
jgi:UDP-2,3-diacylglucosamine pyrophosphatase LpxH